MAEAKSRIHATALIDPRAELADDVEVGPYSIIGPHVKIGAGTKIASHVVIEGRTTIGARNRIQQFNSVGGDPQDKKYKGEPTELIIGDDNLLRECGTYNTGTVQGGGVTRLGNDNWIMAYTHVAHDCIVGSHTILANKVQLAGHVEVHDWAILGGDVGVYQFVRVGAHAMIGADVLLLLDVPPFSMIGGQPPAPHGINVEGLKRRGFAPEVVAALREAHKTLYRSGLTLTEAREQIEQQIAQESGTPAAVESLRMINDFLGSASRGIMR
jgi:UDP-N-acetylglucosamine acyltransferase